MTLSKPLIGFFILGGLSYASSLAVYQDSTFYDYIPSSPFIGFTKGVSAKCEGSTVALVPIDECLQKNRLCAEMGALEESKEDVMVVDANIKVLEKFLSLPQPTVIDAVSWIESARLIGTEQAKLLRQKESLSKKFKRKGVAFRKQAPSPEAKQTAQSCPKELSLTIPYGYVSFSTSYEANVEKNEVQVTQKLSILNRSGIDIEADSATFYYRSANKYVNPRHFSPWIVSKYLPQSKRMYKKTKVNTAPMREMSMVAEERLDGDIMPAPVASYEDAREYKMTHLKLPSTGVALDVEVLSWKAPMECELRAYPYLNTKAFEMCSFAPKYQIDANTWKVKSGSEVINEHTVGEYRNGTYNLYTKVEDNIKILRKPIVQKERKTGIFGGTARKQDGFTLTLTNKSDKSKTLTLIERVPTSTTTEIKSKLLSIKGKNKVDYTLLKEGKIEMHITLNAYETQKIDVVFEISYDKDLKVKY